MTLPAAERARAQQLYDDGATAYEIARTMGRPPTTIYRWLDPDRMRRSRALGPEEHKELQRRYDKGATVQELMEELGYTRGVIEDYLDKGRMRPRGRRPIDRNRVLRLHRRGTSPARIAQLMGCSADTVRNTLARFAPKESA